MAGALSALADDLGLTTGQRSASGSLPAYSAPFGKQNAFASGRILEHGAALVAGFVGVAGGGALAGTGVAATTTGVLAPAGAVAVAGGAVITVAGAAVVTSATANITAGDPNIHFSTAQGNGTGPMVGENGTQVRGSQTTGQNGKTERVDVENPAPGQRLGDVHYHEPNNTKRRYDIASGQLVNPKTRTPAPSNIQNVLKEEWFQKAIRKALNILGE